MLLVKLTTLDDGSIRAESPNRVLGFFDDMTVGEVRDYLLAQAAQVDERIVFVDEFEPAQERLNVRQLMKGKKKK
jgi:hypothetical protein